MKKKELTEFGRKIEIGLISFNQTQEWLIEEVRKKSGMYVDRSIMHKIKTGQVKDSALNNYIRDVLEMP